MLRINSLSYSYHNQKVLNNISLNIAKGELWIVLGINGAGKTTFLKSISKQLEIAPNTVFIKDRDIQSYKQKDIVQHISYLPQQTIFNASFKVSELLELTHNFYNKNKTGNYDEIVTSLNLNKILAKKIDCLSGGEKQKTAFACVLIQDSAYYCLDEPLNNLDPENISTLIKIWENLLFAKGKTLIIILHHWQNLFFSQLFKEAKTILLKDGEIYYQGKLSAAQDKLSTFYNTALYKVNYNNNFLYL